MKRLILIAVFVLTTGTLAAQNYIIVNMYAQDVGLAVTPYFFAFQMDDGITRINVKTKTDKKTMNTR